MRERRGRVRNECRGGRGEGDGERGCCCCCFALVVLASGRPGRTGVAGAAAAAKAGEGQHDGGGGVSVSIRTSTNVVFSGFFSIVDDDRLARGTVVGRKEVRRNHWVMDEGAKASLRVDGVDGEQASYETGRQTAGF